MLPSPRPTSDAEFLAWLATATPTEVVALARPGPSRLTALAARHYRVSRLTFTQLGWLSAGEAARLALCQNPDLTRPHAEALLERGLRQFRIERDELLLLVEALTAAGHAWARPALVDRLRALMADGTLADRPKEYVTAALELLLNLAWFEHSEADLRRILRMAPTDHAAATLATAIVQHPAATADLVRVCLERHRGVHLRLAVATSPLVGAHADLLDAVLDLTSPETLPVVARYCTPTQLAHQIATLVREYSSPTLLAMFEGFAPDQLARLSATDLLPLLQSADAEKRLTGQVVLGMLPAREAAIAPAMVPMSGVPARAERGLDAAGEGPLGGAAPRTTDAAPRRSRHHRHD